MTLFQKIRGINRAVLRYKFNQLVVDKLANQVGYNVRRNIWKDAKALVATETPVLIDGGANFGEMTELFLADYRAPKKIYAIEANPDLAALLTEKFKDRKNVQIIGKAIGSAVGEIQFNIANNLNSSSVYTPSDTNRKYHGSLTAASKTVTVPLTRLDKEIEDPVVDVLKLDLEGYELEALKGASELLPRVKVIIAESWFVTEFEGAPRLSDLETYLRQHGFRLLNIYNMYTQDDMQLTICDAIFVNTKFFPQYA